MLHRTYAIIAKEMVDNVTDIFNHAKKVLSFEKNTFGSTFTGTLYEHIIGHYSINIVGWVE